MTCPPSPGSAALSRLSPAAGSSLAIGSSPSRQPALPPFPSPRALGAITLPKVLWKLAEEVFRIPGGRVALVVEPRGSQASRLASPCIALGCVTSRGSVKTSLRCVSCVSFLVSDMF